MPDGGLSGFISTPAGLASLRGSAATDGSAVTLTLPDGQTITGTLTADAECKTLSGTLDKPFTAKRLPVEPRTDLTDPAALADAVRSFSLSTALLADISDHIDLSSLDPSTVGTAVGADPEALRKWVSENTLLLPYEGALRSPKQVLADQRGNSLDRARLLAMLLQQAGLTARLAHGQLPAETLANLYDVGKMTFPPEPVLVPSFDIAGVAQRVPGVDAAKLQQDAAAFAADTTDPTDGTKRILESLLAQVPSRASGPPALPTDYWWTEYEKDGSWAALPLDAVQPPNPTAVVDPDKLPDEDYQRLTITVVAKAADADGKLGETTVYSGTVRAEEAADAELALTIMPGGAGLPETPSDLADGASQAREALAGEKAWMPVLRLGDEVSYQNVLLVDGRVMPVADAAEAGLLDNIFPPDAIAGASSATGGALGALGSIFSDEEKPPPPEIEDRLTNVFVDYAIEVPGAPTRVERRSVWDRFAGTGESNPSITTPLSLDARAERATSFVDVRQVVVRTFAERSESLLKRLADSVSDSTRELLDLAGSYASGTTPETFPDIHPAALAPEAYELLRREASPGRIVMAVQRPDIVTFVGHPGGVTADALPQDDLRVDIIESGLVPYWFGEDPFPLLMQDGIASTVAEADAIDRGIPVLNTARTYLESIDKGTPWIVYQTAEDLSKWPLPAAIADVAAAELRRGEVIVAPGPDIEPGGAPFAGYWRIDPYSGETLGMNTLGGESVEYEKLTEDRVKAATKLNYLTRSLKLALCVASFYVSSRSKFNFFMMILCIAGEGLNWLNNYRAYSRLGQVADFEAQAAQASRLAAAGWPTAAKAIAAAAAEAKLASKATDAGYALAAAWGNVIGTSATGINFLTAALR